MPTTILEHKAGELAYLDTTFSGLIPCKVLSVGNVGEGITVKLTANRGAYHTGEILTARLHRDVVPRSSVYVQSGIYKIRNDYTWSN